MAHSQYVRQRMSISSRDHLEDVPEDPILIEDWPPSSLTLSSLLCRMKIIEPTSES